MITECDEIVLLQAFHIVSLMNTWEIRVHIFHVISWLATHHVRKIFCLAQDPVAIRGGEAKIQTLVSFF
jgi:hypothetical protein